MADLKKVIGEQIRSIRKFKGYTQESLADRSGVSFSYISDVERGTRNISLISLEKIMNALDINPDEIFNYEDSPRSAITHEKREIIERIEYQLSPRPLAEVKFIHAVAKKFADILDE